MEVLFTRITILRDFMENVLFLVFFLLNFQPLPANFLPKELCIFPVRVFNFNLILKISQNSRENTCGRDSFLIKLMVCNFIKKESPAQVFSCGFCEISKNTFLYRTLLVAASKNYLGFGNFLVKLTHIHKYKRIHVLVNYDD